MNIQWYPGHMTKAKRAMKEDIKLIDLVIELVDARVPLSSRNPDIDDLAKGKARMVLLNKSDLADERVNAQWAAWFEAKNIHAVKVDSRNKGTLKQVQSVVQEACKEKIERDRKRGIMNRPIRTMVVGIPNGQIHLHQFLCRQGMCKDRQQAGGDKGKPMDPPQ